jgi:hypothetical protein
MEVSGQLHSPALLLQGNNPWYPLDRRLGGLQSRPGYCGEEKSLLPCRESNPECPVPKAVLYQLSYPAKETFSLHVESYEYRFGNHLVALDPVPWLGIHDDAATSSAIVVVSSCCGILRVSDLVSKAYMWVTAWPHTCLNLTNHEYHDFRRSVCRSQIFRCLPCESNFTAWRQTDSPIQALRNARTFLQRGSWGPYICHIKHTIWNPDEGGNMFV